MNKNLRIAICDDEKNARAIVSASVKSVFGEYEVETEVETYATGKELWDKLKTCRYDIVFLDINMPVDGILLGRKIAALSGAPELVFVSSKTDRVFDTFELRPFGFVRKDKFMEDISSVIGRYVKQKFSDDDKERSFLVKDGGSVLKLNLNNIKYIENQGNTQILYFNNKETQKIYSRLETLEKQLTESGFIRLHKGYLCNAQFIKRFDSTTVTLTTGETLPIGRSRKNEAVQAWMAYVRRNNATLMG